MVNLIGKRSSVVGGRTIRMVPKRDFNVENCAAARCRLKADGAAMLRNDLFNNAESEA